MSDKLRILIIDDSATDCEALQRNLYKEGVAFSHRRVWEIQDVRDALSDGEWDVIICDHFLPTFESLDVLNLVNQMGLGDIPLILVSGQVDTKQAIQAMRSGANDYLFKDDLSRLVPAINREVSEAKIRHDKKMAEMELRQVNNTLKRTLQSLSNTQDQLISVERFRALGQMSSGITHDFNNALQKIVGSVYLIEENPGNPEYIKQIRVQLKDASTVVRRLTEFYRETPAQDETTVDIGELLKEIKEFTRPRWGGVDENSFPISVTVESDSFDGVWGDPSKLREVLTNLIFNACDALGKAGGEIYLKAEARGEMIDVSVADTGSGMTDAVLERCLDPLYTTKGELGTGMGLSIVNGIVQSFGGTLQIKSELGVGTTVTLSLRKAALIHRLATPQENDSGNLHSQALQIAVVDDETSIATLIERFLEKLGHQVHTFTNPVEALQVIEESNFDLLVTDRAMPQLSGDQLIENARKKHPAMKCIMVSGYGDLMLVNGELPDGVDLIIGKPIYIESIQKAIEDLFEFEPTEVALCG